jgi:hypothetical protein
MSWVWRLAWAPVGTDKRWVVHKNDLQHL